MNATNLCRRLILPTSSSVDDSVPSHELFFPSRDTKFLIRNSTYNFLFSYYLLYLTMSEIAAVTLGLNRKPNYFDLIIRFNHITIYPYIHYTTDYTHQFRLWRDTPFFLAFIRGLVKVPSVAQDLTHLLC